MNVRLTFALALLAFPAAAQAGSVSEDRYGPAYVDSAAAAGDLVDRPTATTPSFKAPARYAGRFLSWANKPEQESADGSTPDVPAADRKERPTEFRALRAPAPASTFASTPPSIYVSPSPAATQAPVRAAPSASPMPALVREEAPIVVARVPAPPPAPIVARPAIRQPVVATVPPPVAERQRSAMAAASRPVAVAEVSPAPNTGAPARAHFYSLHREYGDQPDSIAIPVDRPAVLIGPADSEAPASDEEANSKSDRAELSAPF